MKTCPHCQTIFTTTHSHKRFCSPKCQIRASGISTWDRIKTSYKGRCRNLIQLAKNRAKSNSLPFDLEVEYLVELWEKQNYRCAISGREFDLARPSTEFSVLADAPSLDRIEPAKGYTKGNVRIVCYQINTALNQYGLEALIMLCHDVLNHQGRE